MKKGCKVCLGITGLICLGLVIAAIVIGVFYTPKIPSVEGESYNLNNFWTNYSSINPIGSTANLDIDIVINISNPNIVTIVIGEVNLTVYDVRRLDSRETNIGSIYLKNETKIPKKGSQTLTLPYQFSATWAQFPILIAEWAGYQAAGQSIQVRVVGTIKAGVITAAFKIPLDTIIDVYI